MNRAKLDEPYPPPPSPPPHSFIDFSKFSEFYRDRDSEEEEGPGGNNSSEDYDEQNIDFHMNVSDGSSPLSLDHHPIDMPLTDAPLTDASLINLQNVHIPIPIPTIVSETKLSQYIDNHFVQRLNEDLEKIRAGSESKTSSFNHTSTPFRSLNQRKIKSVPADSHSSWSMTDKNVNAAPEGQVEIFGGLNAVAAGGGGGSVGGGSASSGFEDIEPLNHYIRSNSPLTLSNENSDSDTNEDVVRRLYKYNSNNSSFYGGESKYPAPPLPPPPAALTKFRNLTHKEVERTLEKYYDDKDTKYSSELDILITYLKGQKNLYIQSKNVAQYKLNSFLIPTIVITGAITIFAPFIQQYSWSGGFISGLNATITLLVSIVNYLKLESSVEMFYHTANQYDKLETSLEFVASKMLFVQDDNEKSNIVLEKIQEIEKKISEIKEWNALFVPEEVRQMFPIICHINIFSFIKRMEVYKKNLVIKFKDVKNEMRYILHKISKQSAADRMDFSDPMYVRQEKRLQFLSEVKDKIKEEIVHYRTAYGHIDEIFTKEIQNAQRKKGWFYLLNQTFFGTKINPHSYEPCNPVIDKYLHFIFTNY